MALVSGGQLVLSDTTNTFANMILPPSGLRLTNEFPSYAAIYKRQLWVYTLVTKLAKAQARLPLKVYERTGDEDRNEARDHPYAELLRNPNPRHDPKFFWLWTASTKEVYGEAIWLKVRDDRGIPRQLWPLHPANVTVKTEDTAVQYHVYLNGVLGGEPSFIVPSADVVHFKTYNPDTTLRGLSFLEPLRATLENEDAARKANSALWRNGGRPSVFLRTEKTLSSEATQRLAAQWANLHGGVDNWARAAVLEEGLQADTVALNAEELQYTEARKLNREEVCAAADVPPPVVHILDRATFSNITEQMRSMYRDTMAPRLGLDESVLDYQLRPDFGNGVYAEFLMDEVLRGSFETRVAAWATAISSGQATPAEARKAENRPFIEGSDQLLVNTAAAPLDAGAYQLAAALVRSGWEPAAVLETLGLPPIEHTGVLPVTVQPEDPPKPVNSLDALWGRLGTVESLDDIDPNMLTAGLNGHADMVRVQLELARAEGLTVPEFRARLRSVLQGETNAS